MMRVATNNASDIIQTAGTLNGELPDLGPYEDEGAEVWFEWGLEGCYLWETTKQVMYALGNFSARVSQLAGGVEYHFRALASALDGSGEIMGDNKTFTTLERAPFHSVLTNSPLCKTSKEVMNISQLYIDAHKYWGMKGISNLKELAEDMVHGDLSYRGKVGLATKHVIVRLRPGEPGEALVIRAGHLQWEELA